MMPTCPRDTLIGGGSLERISATAKTGAGLGVSFREVREGVVVTDCLAIKYVAIPARHITSLKVIALTPVQQVITDVFVEC
jgi:hypothetical protein